MRELIKELLNSNKDTIRIDYIVEKLKNIYVLEEYILNEIDFEIDNIINDEYEEKEIIDKVANFKDEDLNKIKNEVLDNDWLWSEVNSLVNDAIRREIFIYLKDKKESEE